MKTPPTDRDDARMVLALWRKSVFPATFELALRELFALRPLAPERLRPLQEMIRTLRFDQDLHHHLCENAELDDALTALRAVDLLDELLRESNDEQLELLWRSMLRQSGLVCQMQTALELLARRCGV